MNYLLHKIAHLIQLNYVIADAQVEDHKVIMYTRCRGCNKLEKL